MASGFLVSMPKVFEDFVTTAFREALGMRFGGRGVCQDARWFLDERRTVALRPDLVWYPVATGAPALVLDAKYKPRGTPGSRIPTSTKCSPLLGHATPRRVSGLREGQ